ncbi:MAG: hypothetical protein ACOCQ1_00575 [Halanaerobiaceae bacterium]
MDEFINLLSLPLKSVKKYFVESESEIKVLETKPPGDKEGRGQKRVIAIKKNKNFIKIIWCYERFS